MFDSSLPKLVTNSLTFFVTFTVLRYKIIFKWCNNCEVPCIHK